MRAQYGDWTFFSHPGAAPDDCVPLGDYYTVLRGIRTVFPESEVVYAKGCDLMEYTSDAMMQEAIELAESADIVICVIGDCLKQNGEARDRANLELSGRQNELVRRLKETGKQIVTVLVNGKPLCIGEAVKNSSAVIEMFNGGDLGGLCVAELIAGKWNPSGKLPISFPRASAQIPCYYNTYPGWHGEKYMDVEKENLYDFGYGLSYTTYAYSDIMLSSATAKAGDVLTVSVDVTNTGDMDGYETVQMYYNDRFSSVLTPEKQLCGFAKVFIKAGETVRVELPLAADALSLVNADEKTILEPGIFDIMVGGGLHSLKSAELTVE
jgi:beta-glucosidase